MHARQVKKMPRQYELGHWGSGMRPTCIVDARKDFDERVRNTSMCWNRAHNEIETWTSVVDALLSKSILNRACLNARPILVIPAPGVVSSLIIRQLTTYHL